MFESGVDEVGGGALDRLGAGVEELAEGRGDEDLEEADALEDARA